MDSILKEIITELVARENIQISVQFPHSKLEQLLELECLKTLEKIKAIVSDDSLSDFDCIEKTVSALENAGISCGSRHDF